MKRLAGLGTLGLALLLQGCLSSTLVLHVAPDGSGRAVITSRLNPARLPGATLPVDREVFLEFEPPVGRSPVPQAAPQAPPPDTDIFLAPLSTTNGRIDVGPPVNITHNPGYDNQPFFTPDGASILFTSVRGGSQSDVYRYDLAASRVAQVTNTPESEYSPTITPSGALSTVRVELDEAKTQRLWQFTADGRNPRLVLERIKPVGYHAWADDHTLALFVLGQPATLRLADAQTGAERVVATDIGRSLQRIPGGSRISFVQRQGTGATTTLLIKELDPATGEARPLIAPPPGDGEVDLAWMPDGTLLVARGDTLHAWRRGDAHWTVMVPLAKLGLKGVSRLAVSPRGDWIALVATG